MPIDDLIANAASRMDKSVETIRAEFNTVRTGRASTALLDRMTPRIGSSVARLTDRQYEVLRLLSKGLSNGGIAEALGITEKSVQNHINAMYSVLGIDADPARNPRVTAALRLVEETGRM